MALNTKSRNVIFKEKASGNVIKGDVGEVGNKYALDKYDIFYDQGDENYLSNSGENLKYNSSSVPELNIGNNSVYGSDSINDNIKSVNQKISETEADVMGGIDYKTELSNLINTAKSINEYTDKELAQIEQAGKETEGVWNAEIQKAQAAKEAGMGKSTIGTGRMGGFMNTQLSGAAAITPGVSDWAGAGGKLESIKSAYDTNISDLELKKSDAIALAKKAKAEYIRTGKTDALNAAQQALQAAQTINNQIIQNQSAKSDLLIKASQEARTQKTYDTTEASTAVANMAQAGLETSAIPQETKSKYEQLLGLPSGSFDKFYDDVKLATQFAQEGRYTDFTGKITEILSSIPEGQTITINGKEYKGLGTKTGTQPTSSIQEYEYYAKQEKEAGRTPMSYESYQNEDANRKILASTIANSSGMNTTQQAQFMNITNNYQKDALVQAYDKGKGLVAIADQVISDPGNAANQLKSLYILVKNLDPDSAVREGEISLAQKTNSYLQQFQTALTRIGKGQVIAPDTAKLLAEATKELVTAWETGVNARKQRYTSQANVIGIGQAFNQYLNSSADVSGAAYSDTGIGGIENADWSW